MKADPKQTKWVCMLEDYHPVSPNQRRGAHWSEHHKDRQRADHYLFAYAQNHPVFTAGVHVTIERIWCSKTDQPFDFDNIIGGAKTLIDGLTAPLGRKTRGLGVIQDDNQKVIQRLSVGQIEVEPGEPTGTRITITGLATE